MLLISTELTELTFYQNKNYVNVNNITDGESHGYKEMKEEKSKLEIVWGMEINKDTWKIYHKYMYCIIYSINAWYYKELDVI